MCIRDRAKLLLKIAKRGLKKYADVIEYIELGTAVLEDETKEQLKEIFPQTRLYNFYGSTEAGRSCVLDFKMCIRDRQKGRCAESGGLHYEDIG